MRRDAARIDRVAVFDFDWTLFASPQPPAHYTEITWWSSLDSLGSPCVPQSPGSEWWNQSVVDAARRAIQDPATYTVFLTGREADIFEARVFELLDDVGLVFDVAELDPLLDPSTDEWKSDRILRIANRFDPSRIDIYDDVEAFLDFYVEMLEMHDFWVVPHLIDTVPQVAVCEES